MIESNGIFDGFIKTRSKNLSVLRSYDLHAYVMKDDVTCGQYTLAIDQTS